jgi:hypothetical protein
MIQYSAALTGQGAAAHRDAQAEIPSQTQSDRAWRAVGCRRVDSLHVHAMFRSSCSINDRHRSRRLKREQGAVPDNGIALERREALGPTLLGQRARKRQPLVTGDLPWRAADPGFGFANRRRSAGGASRRSIASCERDGKRETGRPGRPNSKPRGDDVCLLGCLESEAIRRSIA